MNPSPTANTFSILHISDLHFGRNHCEQALNQILTWVESNNPDYIFISGDITQRAKKKEFMQASEFIKCLAHHKVFVTPGNHDIPLYRVHERLFNPYRYYQKYIRAELDYSYSDNNLSLYSINTTHPYKRITNGFVRSSQLQNIEKFFTGVTKQSGDTLQTKIILGHHHYHGFDSLQASRPMIGRRSARELFRKLGINLVMGGHIHTSHHYLDPEAKSSFPLYIHSGTSTSTRGRNHEHKSNTFNVLNITKNLESKSRNLQISIFRSDDKKPFIKLGTSEYSF